jgi:ketosteroid isomerase-like protein
MLRLFAFLLIFSCVQGNAQKKETDVLQRLKGFHQALANVGAKVESYIDDRLTYGHSNGWVENKKEFLSNLGNRIVYHSITEDSINVRVNGNVAHARFVAVIVVSLDGKQNQYRLRILEVWIKNKKTWKLFARQAIRA